MAGQGEIGLPEGRYADAGLDVLLGQDGGTAGNGADQGHGGHFRHGLEAGRDGGGRRKAYFLISVEESDHVVKINAHCTRNTLDGFE